jgi:hypothetical protein
VRSGRPRRTTSTPTAATETTATAIHWTKKARTVGGESVWRLAATSARPPVAASVVGPNPRNTVLAAMPLRITSISANAF